MPNLIRPVASSVRATHGWFPKRPIGCTTGCKLHEGMDYAAAIGTPIKAAAGGIVSKAGDNDPTAGNYIVVRHDGLNDGLFTRYIHLKRRLVGIGTAVAQGQTIGYSGESASLGIPHLHFDISAAPTVIPSLKQIGLALVGRQAPGTGGALDVPVEQFLPEPNMDKRFMAMSVINDSTPAWLPYALAGGVVLAAWYFLT